MQKPALRRGKTIWLGRTSPATRYPVLRGHHETDIAIVGGGLTGALTAEAFVRAGARVTVVEANRVCLGSTAASTALLLQEPDYDLEALTERYGSRDARRMWRLSQGAARDFIDTIRRLRVRCNLVERDSLYYTLSEERARALQRELRLRRRGKLGGEWLDAQAFERASGIRGAGAIRTRGNAQLNPLAAAIGILAAAARSGAQVFERTKVHRIRATGTGVRLYAPHGQLDAERVVIATGYATQYFKPLAGRFKMRNTYVLATPPIPARLRREIGMGEVMLWDTARPYHYVRWTEDHRLLLGGEDRPVKPGARRDAMFQAAASELRDYFKQVFPALGEVPVEFAWEGLFAMTPDGMPYIGAHRRYPRHHFALGYGGNGMTFAALAARMLVEQWRGHHSPDHALFAFNRSRRPARR